MLDERQKRLVSEHGPSFCKRNSDVQEQFIYLLGDATSILTDIEMSELSEGISKAITELKKAEKIVVIRMKEAGLPVR